MVVVVVIGPFISAARTNAYLHFFGEIRSPGPGAVDDISKADGLNLAVLLPDESVAEKIVAPCAVLIIESKSHHVTWSGQSLRMLTEEGIFNDSFP